MISGRLSDRGLGLSRQEVLASPRLNLDLLRRFLQQWNGLRDEGLQFGSLEGFGVLLLGGPQIDDPDVVRGIGGLSDEIQQTGRVPVEHLPRLDQVPDDQSTLARLAVSRLSST